MAENETITVSLATVKRLLRHVPGVGIGSRYCQCCGDPWPCADYRRAKEGLI